MGLCRYVSISYLIDHSVLFSVISESQRDSVTKPRVARTALPWEMFPLYDQPQRGCVLMFQFHTSLIIPFCPHFISYFPTNEALIEMTQPLWGWDIKPIVPQGSAWRATLGFVTESRWDSKKTIFAQSYFLEQ